MSTLAEIRDYAMRFLDRTGAPAVESTDIDRLINQAVRQYITRRHSWQHMQAVFEADTQADRDEYPFPRFNTKALEILSLKGTGSTDDFVVLDEITERQNRWNWLQTTSSGKPSEWCRFNDYIRLRPIPDDVYTMRVVTYEYPETLVLDDDSNAVTNHDDALVDRWVLANALAYYSEPERAQAIRQLAEAELAAAIVEDKKAGSPKNRSITPSLIAGIPTVPGRSGFARQWMGR